MSKGVHQVRKIWTWQQKPSESKWTHPLAVAVFVHAGGALPSLAVEAGAVALASSHRDVPPQEAAVFVGNRPGLILAVVTNLQSSQASAESLRVFCWILHHICEMTAKCALFQVKFVRVTHITAKLEDFISSNRIRNM